MFDNLEAGHEVGDGVDSPLCWMLGKSQRYDSQQGDNGAQIEEVVVVVHVVLPAPVIQQWGGRGCHMYAIQRSQPGSRENPYSRFQELIKENLRYWAV